MEECFEKHSQMMHRTAVRNVRGCWEAHRHLMPAVYRGTGTVTRVVRDLGAVMIAHDPVPELKWPAMNMTFGVRSDALLQSLEQDERIDFLFVKSGDNYIITSISQPVKGKSREAH